MKHLLVLIVGAAAGLLQAGFSRFRHENLSSAETYAPKRTLGCCGIATEGACLVTNIRAAKSRSRGHDRGAVWSLLRGRSDEVVVRALRSSGLRCARQIVS